MPTTGSAVIRNTVRYLALFAIVGVSIAGVQLITANPCDTPTTWSVGRVDSQFGLSEEMVAQYGKEATDIWNASYQKNPLLAYREHGGEIALNFVYDERMQTTIRNQRLKRSIEQGKNALSNIQETLESLREEYTALGKTISSLTAAYDAHLNAYNKEVMYWNAQGGAPKDAYTRLQNDERKLEDERNFLNTKINYYNQLGERIRTYGETHNEVVESLNDKIVTLNETGVREFEEGIYDPNNNTITIYEYSSPVALKRVLAHEFGHALSIGHVESEDSIMYPINQGRSLELSTEDITALSSACKKKELVDFLEYPVAAFDIIRGGISRLVGLSSPDTAAQAE